ncbi:hypothetical protein [Streptomyces sp. NBC_01511]|uniref:hypothetical protein n=1 Tax=Streptomyces sp. NBC_01511 TaxID=2903889 RepID=UPI0038654AC7
MSAYGRRYGARPLPWTRSPFPRWCTSTWEGNILLAGYRAGGGGADFGEVARLRMALYRCYLYLIMLVEGVPRGYPPAHTARTRRTVGPALVLVLGLISTAS